MMDRSTNPSPDRMDVCEAAEDLRRRTLTSMPRALDRMIYLASMRDYNTGLYYHDGLAARFSQDVASEAIAQCHREAFRHLVTLSLRELVIEIEGYLASIAARPEEFFAAWQSLQPYRIAVPAECDNFSAELLCSNFKIALAILGTRLSPSPEEQGASPRPSLGR